MTPGNTSTLIGQTLGGYQLLSLLGAGGMAEVYLAKDPKLGREVAVKVLPASLALDAGYVERFRDEARRVAALSHPNIVPVYYYGEERGLLFLVMPVLRESLRERMEREGALPVSDAARYVVQIAAALDAAHAQGLVHRDVKPENILLNTEGKALLTDFGIAREASFLKQTGANRTLASTGLPVGTPEYMAPEQLRAGLVDQRADIYALGAVFYELLTGTVPHDAPTPYEVAALVLTAPLTPPSKRNRIIWPELERVVMKALSSDPNDRYPSTRAFAMAVRDAVLHRDSSVSRLTMPAVSSEVPVLAALSARAPTTRTLTDLERNDSPDTRTSQPVTTADEPWRERFRPAAIGGRRTVLIGALIALVLVGVCGGGGIAFLSGFSLPFGTSGAQPPLTGGGATNTISTAPGATDTASSTSATATASATAMQPPTSTPISPPPTATINPIHLTFNPTTIPLSSHKNNCTGSQTITNQSGQPLSWRWASPVNFTYIVTRNGMPVSSGPDKPQDPNLPSGQTDTLAITVPCNELPASPYAVTVTDSLGGSYTINLQMSQ